MNPTGRMSYGEKALCVGATIAMLIIVYFTATEPRGKVVTSEQFPAELAEQNRQADVASQLRASQRGDLVELLDEYRLIHKKGNDSMTFLSWCKSDDNGVWRVSELSPFVKRVIRQESPVFVDAIKVYLRCESTTH